MRIHFQRGGGLAAPAMRQSYTVETDALPDDEAQELRDLINSADIPSLAGRTGASRSAPRPDAFSYRLVIEDGDQRHTVEASDADMPATLRPLVSWMIKRASSASSSS